MRRAHVLKTNLKSEQWSDFLFFDTETTPQKISETEERLRFALAWGCYVRVDAGTEEWRECWRRRDLYEFMLSKCLAKRRLVVISHNLYFDLRVSGLLVRLLDEGWLVKRQYVAESGVQSFFLLRNGDRSILFIDSMNWFNTSVKKLGALYGYPKYDVDFQHADSDYLSAYCSRDVEIIRVAVLAWLSFIKTNNLGNCQKTLASQAFSSFRHRFMRHPICIHSDARAARLERCSYFGGRVENYCVGLVPQRLYKLDINSMYPSVMSGRAYPHKLLRYYHDGVSVDKLRAGVERLHCIAHVTLETDVPRYPLRRPGRVIYPIGRFATVLQGETLKAALDSGHVTGVMQVAAYQTAPLFDDFVDYFWSERRKAQESGNEVYTYLYKILMNSLYGKFGQRGFEQQRHEQDVATGLEVESAWINGRIATIWTLGRTVFVNYKVDKTPTLAEISQELPVDEQERVMQGEGYNSFCAISASITDHARDLLWRLMEQAGREHVYYVDTDCLFVDSIGRERLEEHVGSGLGQLKVEGETDHCVLYAPKDYEWGEETKRKGVPKGSVSLDEEGLYAVKQWERWRTGLRLGMRDDYRIVTRRKRLSRVVEHGVVGGDGRVSPFRLG